MASVGHPRAFGLDPPTGSGRARGSLLGGLTFFAHHALLGHVL